MVQVGSGDDDEAAGVPISSTQTLRSMPPAPARPPCPCSPRPRPARGSPAARPSPRARRAAPPSSAGARRRRGATTAGRCARGRGWHATLPFGGSRLSLVPCKNFAAPATCPACSMRRRTASEPAPSGRRTMNVPARSYVRSSSSGNGSAHWCNRRARSLSHLLKRSAAL